ncbi:MAG: hypothetical protein M3014_00755 [Chloroflexota bacterium]|nr:hypothetical protein [Chloroflexota bacterium]
MKDYTAYLNETEDEADGEYRPRYKTGPTGSKPKKSRAAIVAELTEKEDDTREGFDPSFTSSRHEREWILTYLGGFYEDQQITDVLRQVKGGKEATVYCCEAHPRTGLDLVAAKVYRPRMFRNLRNDGAYRQGRDIIDDSGHRGKREERAMKKRTDFGQELLHLSWVGNEFGTMQKLYAAGVDIPKPISFSDNVILMEYVGEETCPAPILHSVRLHREEAEPLFRRLLEDIELMLNQDKVHSDLSAHNILYWEGKCTIIDFPQAVDPIINPQARTFLERDVTRVCQYFERYGIKSDPRRLATDMWENYTPDE